MVLEARHQIAVPGEIGAVALGAGGSLAAVTVARSGVLLFEIYGETIRPGGSLDLSPSPGRPAGPDLERIWIGFETVAFLDDQTLLVARGVRRWYRADPPRAPVPAEECFTTDLAALCLRTGASLGEFRDSPCDPPWTPPLPIGDGRVLFNPTSTVICVEVPSFREAWRVRRVEGEEIVPPEEGALGDEQAAPNGLAYDAASGILYVLWRVHREAFLQTYRIDPGAHGFTRLGRRSVLRGHEAAGLCLNPDGTGVTGWFLTDQEIVRDDRPPGEQAPPATARLGMLGIFGPDEDRFVEVFSDVDRDFACSPHLGAGADPDGPLVPAGFTVGVDFHYCRPFYLAPGRVAVNTPGGLLLGVDTDSGRAEVLHDFHAPIVALDHHPATRRLLVGCEGGRLALLSWV
ncbi:MAG: hypothetical protein U0790_23650 [Isosphaeraceae bacterium]